MTDSDAPDFDSEDPDADGSVEEVWDPFGRVPAINRNQLLPGTMVGSRYEIVSEIRSGGMGIVYEVVDRHWQNSPARALKTIKLREGLLSADQAAQRAEVVRRFETEGEFQVQLRHDHVVRVYDRGHWEEEPYLVLDLIAGWSPEGERGKRYLTLNDWLKDKESLKAGEAVEILLQLSQALAAVHQQGVIHRDIKPENIFLDTRPGSADPLVRLGDFGIARSTKSSAQPSRNSVAEARDEALIDTRVGDSAATSMGQLLGTPGYIAPELISAAKQAQDVASATTSKCDIWSLGVMAYLLTKGAMPTSAELPDLLAGRATKRDTAETETESNTAQIEFSHIQDVDLRQLLERCLATDPNYRPSADDLVKYLVRWKNAEPLPWTTTRRRWMLWSQKHRLQVSIMSSLLLIALTAGLYTWRLFTLNETIDQQRLEITKYSDDLSATNTQLTSNLEQLSKTTQAKETETLRARLNAANTLEVTGQRIVQTGQWLSAMPFLTEAYAERIRLDETGNAEVKYDSHSQLTDRLRMELIREASPRLVQMRKFDTYGNTTASFTVIPGMIGVKQYASELWDTKTNESKKFPVDTYFEFSSIVKDEPVAPFVNEDKCGLINLKTGSQHDEFAFPEFIDASIRVEDLKVAAIDRTSNNLVVLSNNLRSAFLVDLKSGEVTTPIVHPKTEEVARKNTDLLQMSQVEYSENGRVLLLADEFALQIPLSDVTPESMQPIPELSATIFSTQSKKWTKFELLPPFAMSPNGNVFVGIDRRSLKPTLFSTHTSRRLASVPCGSALGDILFSEDSDALFTIETGQGQTRVQKWSLINLQDSNLPLCIGSIQLPGDMQQATMALGDGPLALALSSEPGLSFVHLLSRDLQVVCPAIPHAERVNSLQFDPSGRFLLTACSDDLVRIWDLVTPLVNRLVVPESDSQASFVDDAKYGQLEFEQRLSDRHLKVFRKDNQLTLVDETKKREDQLALSEDAVFVKIHPSGRLISADVDGSAHIWSIDSPTQSPLVIPAMAWEIAASGRFVSFCNDVDDSVTVLDLEGGSETSIDIAKALHENDLSVYFSNVSLSPDETKLSVIVSGYKNKELLLLLDLKEPNKPILKKEFDSVNKNEIAWSTDSKWISVYSQVQFDIVPLATAGTAYSWKIASLSKPQFLDGPDGLELLIFGRDEYVYQLLGAPSQAVRTVPKELTNSTFLKDLRVVALQPDWRLNTGGIFDPKTNRLLLPLKSQWMGIPRLAQSYAIMDSNTPAPTTTLPIGLLKLPSPAELREPNSLQAKLIAMTKIVDVGETKVLDAGEAIAFWDELKTMTDLGQAVSEETVTRWYQLEGVEYDSDLRKLRRRLPALKYLAQLTGRSQDRCRLGIVECRLEQYSDAMGTLVEIEGTEESRARCWLAIACARADESKLAREVLDALIGKEESIPERDLALAEGVYSEEIGEYQKAVEFFRKCQDMLWVRDWIAVAAAKGDDFKTAYEVYSFRLVDMTLERWQKLAWLSLAAKEFDMFRRSCEYLVTNSKSLVDFEKIHQSLMLLSLDAYSPDRHRWEEEKWQQVAGEVEPSPIDDIWKTLMKSRAVAIDSPTQEEFRAKSLLNLEPDASYSRPLYAATLLYVAATNPRHLETTGSMSDWSRSFQEELRSANQFKLADLKELGWRDRILFRYIVENAEEIFSISINMRVGKLLEEGRAQTAEIVSQEYYNDPYWTSPRHAAVRQELAGVLALLLARKGDKDAAHKLLEEIEQALSDQLYVALTHMALAYCELDESSSYTEFCKRVLHKLGNTVDPNLASALTYTCTLDSLPSEIDGDLRRLTTLEETILDEFNKHRVLGRMHVQTEEFELARQDFATAEDFRRPVHGPSVPIREAIAELRIDPNSEKGQQLLIEAEKRVQLYERGKDENGYRDSWLTRETMRCLLDQARSLRKK